MNLEWPLVSLEPFLFVGRAGAGAPLRAAGVGRGSPAQRLGLELRLEPDGHQTRTIDLPAPTRDVKTLLTLMRLTWRTRRRARPSPASPFIA